MDIATLVGIILGLGAIVGSILLMTPDMGMFVSASSFGIVFGGMLASVAVASVSYTHLTLPTSDLV